MRKYHRFLSGIGAWKWAASRGLAVASSGTSQYLYTFSFAEGELRNWHVSLSARNAWQNFKHQICNASSAICPSCHCALTVGPPAVNFVVSAFWLKICSSYKGIQLGLFVWIILVTRLPLLRVGGFQ